MMRKWPRCGWLTIPGVLLLSVLIGLRGPAEEVPAPVAASRVGLVRSIFWDAPDPLVRVSANIFKSLMEEQTGLPVNVTVPGDTAELALQLKAGKLQLGAFHGFEFAWARLKNPDLKPLMIVVKQQSFVRAMLVVPRDSKAVAVLDLRGQTLALSRLARQHCRLFLERRCVEKGTTPNEWFGKVATPGTDQDALDDVAEGHAHGTVVDDVEWDAFRNNYPKTAAKLRVLQESEIFPCTVIAYQPGTLEENTLKQLRTGMIAAKTTERGRKLLGLFRMTGFEAVPADYEKSLTAIVKAYPPPEN